MKEYLKEIGDVFNIERRLQEIDKGYKIYYNQQKARFEVHNLNLSGDTLCVVCPYECVDVRLINYVRRTRVERANEIFNEIEQENEKILKKQEEEQNRTKESYKVKLMEMKNKLLSNKE